MTRYAAKARQVLLRGHRPWLAAWVLLACGVLCAAPALANCDDPFVDPEQVLDLQLRTTTEVWGQFQSSSLQSEGEQPGGPPGASSCASQYPYFEAEFRCGTEDWLRIGFRRKRDRTESTFKLPIKLDFNRYVDGQRWPAARGELGFRKLSLNSGQPDEAVGGFGGGGFGGGGFGGGDERPPGVQSALLTEHLAWRIMRAELPEASGVAYARLTVHLADTQEQVYQGLYILIEDIDRTAVRARFGRDQGRLEKATDANCAAETEFEDPGASSAAFDAWIAEAPSDHSGSWYQRTNQVLQLDQLLRQEALRELLANTEDTILGRMNNYYALDLIGQRRIYLPWDLDDVFRPEPQAHAADTPLVSSCVGQGGTCAPIPLGVNVRDQPEIRQHYLEILCRLTQGVAQETRLVEELLALDARVRPILEQEVPLLWAPRGEDPLDPDVEGTYAAEVERMREWIPARVAAVRAMIEAEGVECPASCADAAVAACEYYGCPSRRVCSQGLWGACEVPNGIADGRDLDCDGTVDPGVEPGPAPGVVAPGVEPGLAPGDPWATESEGCACGLSRPWGPPALHHGVALLALMLLYRARRGSRESSRR